MLTPFGALKEEKMDKLLLNVHDLIKEYIDNSTRLIDYCKNNDILILRKRIEKPFNVFLVSSDFYYRENFHSDIIAAILQQSEIYLEEFINFINKIINKDSITVNDFRNYTVTREENRIDVLICDSKTKHCIIIENKINNAGDMERQLPKYVEKQHSDGYFIDGILYLSIDGLKRPDISTWTESDKKNMKAENLIYCAAVNDTGISLAKNFIKECISKNISMQEFTFLNQYADLLYYLRGNQMDMNIMEKFYNTIKIDDNYKTAESIKNMVNELITYRRDRIYNHFVNNHLPFDNIGKWSSHDTLFIGVSDLIDESIKFDIFAEEDKTIIKFWIQEPKIKEDYIGGILNKMNLNNDFVKEKDNSYLKEFKFPDEDDALYQYIVDFCKSFSHLKNSITKSST
jgi:hypothetical protein